MKSLLPLSTLFEQGSSKLSSTSKQLALVFHELPKAEAESSTAPVTVLKSSVWILLKLPQRPRVDDGRKKKKKAKEKKITSGKRNGSYQNALSPSPERSPFSFTDFLMVPQIRQHPVFRVLLLFFCITFALSVSTKIGSCLNVLL